MPIHIIGDKSFVLRDPHLEDMADDDVAPALKEVEDLIRAKFPDAQFLAMIRTPERAHYIGGDKDGPLRRDLAAKMAKRLYIWFIERR